MMNSLYHEQLYRTPEVMSRLREFPLAVCGAGALGANIAESLARMGFARLRVIDRDRVEAHNLSTQPYYRADAGAFKARVLANALYRAVGVELDARMVALTEANAPELLAESALVVDAFDNSASRRVLKEYAAGASVACLHAGLAGDYAEVVWNEIYRVPSAAQDDVCNYPLARNLVTLAVGVACESIVEFVSTGARRSHTITLRDFAIRPYQVN
ncbi:MAG: molybdopterin-synthase adenylyltransferase [Pyrinomonadaceae bacterium]|jgi:molybdopterin/thiamine biosynthesis adenylyltransferase|nr:molybdopterin-synthase adenylyltransferase [Pyrinomonadaceae bacterium]